MNELHRLEKLENIQNYILGGKANFIIADKNNKTHLNYTVSQDKKDNNLFYVSYVSTTNILIGIIKIKTIQVNEDIYNLPTFTIKKYLQSEYIFKAEVFNKILLYIYYLNKLPKNIEILYTGICCKCNRTLTDPEYIKIGIGKICLQNM